MAICNCVLVFINIQNISICYLKSYDINIYVLCFDWSIVSYKNKNLYYFVIIHLNVLPSSHKQSIRMTTISETLKSKIKEKYILAEFVQSGTEGRVYKAVRKSDKTKVAVKFVTDGNLDEIKHNTKLRDTGVRYINKMLDSTIDEKAFQFALVLEYMPTDLWEFITANEPTEDVCRIIIRQIITAVMDMATLAKLVHLDLKEENILIDPTTLEIQICDFSTCMDANHLIEILPPDWNHTNYFLAPETVKKYIFYPTRSIVWVIGLMCFNMLNASEDQWKIFSDEIIVKDRLKFKDCISKDARDFVFTCLEVDVKVRHDVKHLLDLPWLKN